MWLVQLINKEGLDLRLADRGHVHRSDRIERRAARLEDDGAGLLAVVGSVCSAAPYPRSIDKAVPVLFYPTR
jgi:hypothetical protein